MARTMQTARRSTGGKVTRSRATLDQEQLDQEQLEALVEHDRSSSPMKMRLRKTPANPTPRQAPPPPKLEPEASLVDLMEHAPLERCLRLVLCGITICFISYTMYTGMYFFTTTPERPPVVPPPPLTRAKVFNQWLSQLATVVGY